MALVAAPFAAQAETWNIYGWQNHSWEFVDIDGGRSFDRIQSNAGNIGFAASVPTGMNDISVNVQCEQFTYYNHFAGGTGWCNRNSKISLSHPQMGEIMFATWLLPYNEGVAQWVDPFYDAGADSHTSIMGSVGANTIFYNTGDFDRQASDSHFTTTLDGAAEAYDADGGIGSSEGYQEFNYAGLAYDTGFNRRQEGIIQYWSPNWNGFVFRFAWTAGIRDETKALNDNEIDPVIRSSSLAYTNGPFWGAVTWQDHEDWTAASISDGKNPVMESSDAESIRVAGRYIMDMGDGMSVQLSAMYEDLEYEFNGTVNAVDAMSAFGFSGFEASGNFVEDTVVAAKTRGLVHDLLDDADADELVELGLTYDSGANTLTIDNSAFTEDDTATTGIDESTALVLNLGDPDTDGNNAMGLDANQLAQFKKAAENAANTEELTDDTVIKAYNALVSGAKKAATADSNVKVEREAWMVSGKLKFGGPVDFRFSYMDADDLEVSCSACSGDWDETAANAFNVGIFYTMPAGTELRLTYSEVDNDDNGTYGQGISGTGLGTAGAEIEMFAVGIVHWFD